LSKFSIFLQYLFSGLTVGSIYALVGMGFNIIFMTTQVINFAQGEFVMLGGLLAVTFTTVLKLPLGVACLLSVVGVTLIGVLFEMTAIRAMGRKASMISMIIATLAASFLFRGVAMLAWGKGTHSLPSFTQGDAISIGGATIVPQTLWVLGLAMGSVLVLGWFFGRTLTGKAMQACSINPDAARLNGISVRRMVTASFGIAAALGAIAGVAITPIALMDYQRGSLLAIKGFAAAALGGLGSGFGAVAAGLIIGILESLTAGYLSSGFKDAVSLLILLGVLFLRPQGLAGKKGA
jgi:branched-chain amino acid transport system permease protein